MSLTTDTKELSDKFQALVSKSFKDNAELFKRFTTLYTDGAKEFSSGLKGEPRQEIGASLTKLAELNIAYWSAAANHSLAFGRDVASAYEKAFGLKDTTPAESKIEITVSARLGARASAAFQLENKVSDTLNVSLSAGDIRSPGGEVVKAVPVTFNPATLSLAPKAQAVVQVSLDVPDDWRVGAVYTLPVKLAGFPSKEIFIRLHIGPPSAGAVKPKSAKGRAKKSPRSKSA
jgi:hypothetical protein